MSGKVWTLKEIRDAYGDALRAYNELFPLHPRERKSYVETFPDLDVGDTEDLNGNEENLLPGN